MTVKAAVITITLFSIVLIISVYIHRGEWAVGSEWLLPIIAATIIPLKDKEDKHGKENMKKHPRKRQLS